MSTVFPANRFWSLERLNQRNGKKRSFIKELVIEPVATIRSELQDTDMNGAPVQRKSGGLSSDSRRFSLKKVAKIIQLNL